MNAPKLQDRRIALLVVNLILSLGAGLLILILISFTTLVVNTEDKFWETFTKTRRADRISFESVPKDVLVAVLAAEGKDFFRCNKYSELKLLWKLFKTHAIIDVPTPDCGISNTVVKGVLGDQHPIPFAGWHLKVLIDVYALQSRLTNREIFEEYANRVYVGEGHFSLEEGAMLIYRKPLSKLTALEAAGLAGILKGPDFYSIVKHPDRFKKRQAIVLDAVKQGGIVLSPGQP